MEFDLRAATALLTVAGSRAYGLHTATSDLDVKGVAIPPKPYYFGFVRRFEQADKAENLTVFHDLLSPELATVVAGSKLEGSVYELTKFMGLAADCNPNILDTLFCRDEDVLLSTPIGQELRENRDLFLSAKSKHTFSGYANAQLKRIKLHRQYLLNPPKGQPKRADFDLPENTLIPAEHLAAISAATQKRLDIWNVSLAELPMSVRVAVQEGLSTFMGEFCAGLPEGLVSEDDRINGAKWLAAARTIGASDNLIYVLQKEREYESAIRGWRSYQTWLRERNSDRAALEAQFGYDTKHAAHLVRLYKMGYEILTTGKVHVWRGVGGAGDAEEIRSVRLGAWTYDQLMEWVEAFDKQLTALYASGKYAVPKQPNRNKLDDLTVRLVEAGIQRF